MIQQFFSRQFIAFLLTGGFAAAVNFGSRIIYDIWMSYSVAIIMAYLTGMVTAFFLVKMFVFKTSQQSLRRSALFFTLVNFVAVIQTWGISLLFAYYFLPWLGVTRLVPEIAHAFGVAVPVFTSYVGHKHWSFR